MRYTRFALAFLTVTMMSCQTFWKVEDLDPSTKQFKTADRAKTILQNRSFDLTSRKDLVLVPSIVGSDSTYFKEMTEKMHFFKEVMGITDLEKEIVKANLSDKIPAIQDRIGLNNAAKYYKPFLWLNTKLRIDDSQSYEQFILTDPLTMEDIFIAEIRYDPAGRGVSDQSVWYPLFNSLLSYLESRSEQ